MGRAPPLLAQVLADPARLPGLSLAEWDLVVRQGRRADLLGRLWVLLDGMRPQGGDGLSPPAQHLLSAHRVAAKQAQVVRYEVAQLRQVLAAIGQPLILLKGAAYVVAELPPARGRIFSDIDILVPKRRLAEVEQAMISNEWESAHNDEYDQRYYREWMHELPPMRHMLRRTVLDIHHSILPETARLHPDPAKLLMEIQPVPGYEDIYTLSDVDMVLHSATHLFHEGELEHGLRDLVDLDALLRHFGVNNAFWERLVERAVELELARPLHYALRYTVWMLNTPVPAFATKAAMVAGQSPLILRGLMDALFERALSPAHESCDDAFTPVARWLLYVRSHYLRMPFHLLIPHLIRKAFRHEKSSAPLAGGAVEKG